MPLPAFLRRLRAPRISTTLARAPAALAIALCALACMPAQAQVAACLVSGSTLSQTGSSRLGQSFTATQTGLWIGVRFFAISGTPFTLTAHQGTNWPTALQTVNNVDGPANSWVTAMFDTPISVAQGQVYSFGVTNSGRQRDILGCPSDVGGSLYANASPITWAANFQFEALVGFSPLLGGTPAAATVGTPFSFTPTLNANATQPISFSVDPATPLPAWLTLNASTGELAGTPAAAGSFPVTLLASNAAGNASLPITVTVAPAPVAPILGGSPGPATVGAPFSFTPTLNANATQPISFSVDPATPLPAWLTLNASTGELTGTPTATGSVTLTLVATNAVAPAALPLSITVIAAAPVAVPTLGTWALGWMAALMAWLGRRRWQPRATHNRY